MGSQPGGCQRIIGAGVFGVAAFIIVVLLFRGGGDDRSPRLTPTRAPTETTTTYTHHNCVKLHNRLQFNGTNLRTGKFAPSVDPERCTDILREDGERLFNIPRSEVRRLILYD